MSGARAQEGPNVQVLGRSDRLCQSEGCDAIARGKRKEKGARQNTRYEHQHACAWPARDTAVRKVVGQVATRAYWGSGSVRMAGISA